MSKCFDSIYTHTMSWAVKSKTFSKAQIPVKSCFGQQFDILMQRSNDNETNGIVIGPESSRIFAEIILQDIDTKSISALKSKHKLVFNKDFVIARYVDDIYIFSVDDDTSRKIAEEYTDHLQRYNLYINELKTVKYSRPFYTINSKIIDQTNTEINSFFAKFTAEHTENGILTLIPSKIFHPDKLINNFVNKIKSICHNTELGCGIASAYIISAIYRRIQKLLRYNINEVKANPEYESYYKAAFFVMLKVAFYFYSLEPSVSSSYMLSRIIIITNNFFCIEFPHISDSIKQKTFELSFQLLKQTHFLKPNHRDDFVPLEKLNIILAISELGHNYLLPPKFLYDLFHLDDGNSGYFQLITCMYYIKDYSQYSSLLPTIKKRISSILSQNLHHTVSETAFTFLDFLSCPYLDLSFREKMLQDYYHYAQLPALSSLDIANRLTFYVDNHWFVKWKGLSLFNALEKKELHSPY